MLRFEVAGDQTAGNPNPQRRHIGGARSIKEDLPIEDAVYRNVCSGRNADLCASVYLIRGMGFPNTLSSSLGKM